MIYFTSDLHLGHTNLACTASKWSDITNTRGFSSIEDHDNLILDNINSRVRTRDQLYILGDFAISSKENIIKYRKRIKCRNIILTQGNHDEVIERYRYLRELFTECKDVKTLKHEGQLIIMCHYSMRTWKKSHRGSWMLFGHSHGNLDVTNCGKTLDVGVDNNNYKPWSFDEIKEYMSTREFQPVDHHK